MRTPLLGTVAFVFAFLPLPSFASLITYDVVALGGGAWRYDYDLTNDTLDSSVDEFTIYFDRTLYANLRDLSGPEGWDLLVAQPDAELPDDGFFDGLSLLAPLSSGSTLGTFSLTFEYLGIGTPGAQRFEFIDSVTFSVIDAGETMARAPPTQSVPEPSTLGLLALGLVCLTTMRRRTYQSCWTLKASHRSGGRGK